MNYYMASCFHKSEGILGDVVKQLYEMILESGFTTVDEVTQISGRGVGMDVVRSSVANLGGSVDVASTAGSGSTFRFRLNRV